MRILVLMLAIFFAGCGPLTAPPPPPKVVNEEEVTWVVERLMAKWKHKPRQRLRLEHAYVYFNDLITGLRLEISSQEILEVREARDLLVDLVEDLLRDINTNPIIASQLSLGTISADNLNIEINFESYFGLYIDPFYVGCIKLKRGTAYYYAFNLKYDSEYAWQSRVESYDKTREISVSERAADKEFERNNPYQRKSDALEGLLFPMDEEEILHPSPLRKF